MYNIDWDELLNKDKIKIIDIRNKDKYLISHVFGSINIESFELEYYPSKYLKKDEIYYIYCDSGNKSRRLVHKLNKLGYNTVNINGGFYNYLFRE